MLKSKTKLISACLVGINCRWDGKKKLSKKCLKLFRKGEFIPICPEQLGGLSTPRDPAEQQKDGRILTKKGENVTKNFLIGAKETLKICKILKIEEAILKSKSPSCGCGKIYDGTFSGKLVDGDGVTTAFLKRNGIEVKTEKDI